MGRRPRVGRGRGRETRMRPPIPASSMRGPAPGGRPRRRPLRRRRQPNRSDRPPTSTSRSRRPAAGRPGPSGSSSAGSARGNWRSSAANSRPTWTRASTSSSAGEPQTQFARTALGPVIGRLLLAVRRGESPGRGDGPRAAGVRPDVPEHDPGGRGPRRRPRDAPDDGRPLRGPHSLIRQARSAMIYPIAVLVIAVGVGGVAHDLPPPDVRRSWDIARPGPPAAAQPHPDGLQRFVRSVGWWVVPLAMVGGRSS